MSDSNRVSLAYVEEVTPGTTPAAALQLLRYTGESLSFDKTKVTSDEINADRNISDLITTGAEPLGAFNFEFSYGTFDDLLVGVFQDTDWALIAISATDISASSVDNSYNAVTTNFVTEGVEAGQWVRVAGFSINPANNDYALVTSVTTTKIIVEGPTLVTEAAGDTVTIDGSTITNGITKKSFTFEKEFQDITAFMSYTGIYPNVFTLDVVSKGKITGALSLVGMGHAAAGTTVGTGPNVAASTTRIMSSVGNIKAIREAGSVMPAAGQMDYIKALSINFNNSMVGKDGVGVLGNVAVRSGEANISGNITAYFENLDLYNKYVADTESYVSFRLEDPDDVLNAYIISIPRLQYGTGAVVVGSKNSDVLINADFQALKHATYGNAIRLDKFAV